MAPIYNNSFRDDIDIINCINSLRRDSQPNPPPNNSNIPPHSNPLRYKDREVIEIFSSDEEEQPETARSKEVRPNRPSSVSSDDYPNDATHWVEYNVRDRWQARAKEMCSDEEEQPETTRSKEDRPNRASLGSPDEYPDPEIDRLIAMVDLQTLDGPSHASPTAPTEPTYNVPVGQQTGIVGSWHRAGHLSQGYPGGKAIRMRVEPPRKKCRFPPAAYVVFEGLMPGIYDTWAQCKAQVYCIPHNVYQGFRTRVEAERAYVLAFAMDSLRILPHREASADTGPAPGGPTPEALMQAFAMASDDFLGAEWHVVFKGKCPGVYPAWNFAATQVNGISKSLYFKYPLKDEAERAFRIAQQAGEVAYL
ncbi:hypothetical protein PILCRDRAFT_3798 [Piloderma croceum F 1598]|uniref:Ribonuclease H1 N-terminal domain-containing protein n=1 Tax=Piloderma croceum (strain F 1598) TaxID=765440 RepID=A0A0C3BLG9_PILCF|nr:hypothetical protein PILCRDRAFT_3798 [Piloderma croceum F 1598]